jgi:phage repressor protein C with HTH and peptisase S24 domain
MKTGDIIRTIRKSKGLTLNELAVRIDSDVGNLSRLERGLQGFTEVTLNKLAVALEVPVAAFFDQITVTSPDQDHIPLRVIDEQTAGFYQIAKVKLRLQAGVTGFQTEPDTKDGSTIGITKSWVDRRGFDPQFLIAMQVKGESMEPTLYEDDVVIINLADKKPVDNGVFAINYDGEAVVKRMSRDAGQWWLMSDNVDQRRFYRRQCRESECIVIGRVVRREGDHI